MEQLQKVDRRKLAARCREHGIVFAGIFGSEARGDATDESDVDLLVRFRTTPSLIGSRPG